MTAVALRRFDKDEFFEWLERQDRRYELVDGEVRMLPWVTRNHNRITTNLVVALSARIDQTRFRVCTGDFAVETGERSIRYADVMVEAEGGDRKGRTANDAIVLIEILSDTSVSVDFKEKLVEYSRLPPCDTYLTCDQERRVVWQWTRSEGAWPPEPLQLEGLDASVALAVLGCRLPLAEIYRGAVD